MKFDKRTQVTLLFVVLSVLAIWWVQSTIRTRQQEVPYSTFRTWVTEGKVESVQVSEARIRGHLKEAVSGHDKTFETIPIKDEELVKTLLEEEVEIQGVAERTGLTAILLTWILPIALMLFLWGLIMKRMGKSAQGGVLSFGKSRSKVVSEKDIKLTFDDVAGVEEAKDELVEVVQFLVDSEKYTNIGARIPKGVLLVGPPGTGKTMLARAVAGESKVPFFLMSGSEFVEMFVGVGASRVRDLFEQAKSLAPCIIFIDELDALGKARGSGGLMGGHDEREQTLNQLLVEMDGFDPTAGVVIMAATNRPEVLDPALLRPGRFDRQVLVDRPDLRGRDAILKIHAAKVRLSEDVDLHEIALRTPGFAGADLANIVNESALLAVRRGKTEVGKEELSEAIDRVVAGLEKKGRLIAPKERRIVAYHEVGHAVVGEVLPHAEKTLKVSIVPRGIAALGMTWQRPTEDRFLMSKLELHDKLAALLAGRAAEEVFLGDISTGAQNDLSRATDIARAMIRQYGMSDVLGPVAYDPQRKPFLPVNEFMPSCEHGSTVGDQIDTEVRRLLESALSRARDVLESRRDTVDRIAERLLEVEQIDGEELRALLSMGPTPPAAKSGLPREGIPLA